MWEMRKAELRKPSYKTRGTFCNKKIDAESCIEYNGLNSISTFLPQPPHRKLFGQTPLDHPPHTATISLMLLLTQQ